MQKGNIGVTTENIFPVIKKFLYSDHEIFLREMVSNAVDATQKMKTLAAQGEYKDDLGDLTVRVNFDADKGTITISDHGIGMTEEEIDKYINQIAFSGVSDFLEKYKDNANNIIGHFGLGFYSSFMVSKKVEIITKSYKEGAKAVKWSCDGSPAYEIDDAERADHGSDIILYIDDDCKEFLDKYKLEGLLQKYCKFMAVPIAFGKKQEWSKEESKMVDTAEDNIINNVEPLWTKAPSTLKDEDYKSFYRTLYPMSDEPLFWIHLNVDYPFNLTGILYFPKIKSNIELQKNKIQLYCNQVFVTDQVEGIVPEFLTLLHGVIDSPDIPLNVSRSYLQSDREVKKISTYITKKVADRLKAIFSENRKEYEEKWDDLPTRRIRTTPSSTSMPPTRKSSTHISRPLRTRVTACCCSTASLTCPPSRPSSRSSRRAASPVSTPTSSIASSSRATPRSPTSLKSRVTICQPSSAHSCRRSTIPSSWSRSMLSAPRPVRWSSRRTNICVV